jgi:hypothetical protein
MGCGCGGQKRLVNLETTRSIRKDDLVNKRIVDTSGKELLVVSPIQDIYGDVIGYITKDSSGNTIRIFAKNVQKIL